MYTRIYSWTNFSPAHFFLIYLIFNFFNFFGAVPPGRFLNCSVLFPFMMSSNCSQTFTIQPGSFFTAVCEVRHNPIGFTVQANLNDGEKGKSVITSTLPSSHCAQ